MSFPPATEMFQFAGFASHGYGFTVRYLKRGGLPHSEIPGSKGARASPGLFAACHVLHRLSTPRHSPDALGSLAPLHKRAPSCKKGSPRRPPGAIRGSPQPGPGTEHRHGQSRSGPKQAYHAWRSSIPTTRRQKPAPRRRRAPGASRSSRTNSCDHQDRTPSRELAPPFRRSTAMPAFDQTCLFTMLKDHDERRHDPTHHRWCRTIPPEEHGHGPVTPRRHKTTRTAAAHAIGVVGLG